MPTLVSPTQYPESAASMAAGSPAPEDLLALSRQAAADISAMTGAVRNPQKRSRQPQSLGAVASVANGRQQERQERSAEGERREDGG